MPQLPTYEQETDTTFAPAIRPLNPPEVQPVDVGGATKEVGDQLNRIWQVQQQHQAQLDLVKKIADFETQSVAVRVNALDQPGLQMGQFYQDETAKIIKKMVADPANAHINPELEIALTRMQAEDISQLTLEGVKATEK